MAATDTTRSLMGAGRATEKERILSPAPALGVPPTGSTPNDRQDEHPALAYGNAAVVGPMQAVLGQVPSATPPVFLGDPLLTSCEQTIVQLANQSPLVQYHWPGRGKAPIGYLRGMALSYARVYCKWKANDPFARAMAKKSGTFSQDAMGWYSAKYQAANMVNTSDGVNTLRHLFVLLVGLGMRESNGQYCEGRDMSASNTSPTTAEAGLFQMSYSIGVGNPGQSGGWLKRQYDVLKLWPYTGFLKVFRTGVTCTQGQLSGFGTTKGGKFREFCVLAPALGAEVAALGLRIRRRHWGPITRREVTLNTDCDKLLKDVQQAVDSGSCCGDTLSDIRIPTLDLP